MRPVLVRGVYAAALCLFSFCLPVYAGHGSSAGRIESVSPAAARPGEAVKITGRGFGAKNARVTVGTRPAAIISASGNAIVFRVPALAAPGLTRVSVRNPGGQGGAIDFTVIGTGPQVAGQDDARRSSAVVSSEGGVVATTSAGGVTFSLEVPPGALAGSTLVSLTPVTSLIGLPLSGQARHAVRMQPAGLHFDRSATLTITLPAGTDVAHLFGFTFDDDGRNFEVLPARIDGTSFALPIAHFTTAGVAGGRLEDFAREVQPLLAALPSSLPPTQVAPLLNQLKEWLRRFGLDVCTQTTLCAQVLDTATRSLALHVDQACTQAMALVAQGEPFQARIAIASIVRLTASIIATSDEAAALGLPGFDPVLNLDCVEAALMAAIDTAREQALDDPRAGELLLLQDLTADAAIVGLNGVESHGRAVLAEVLDTLLERGRIRCESDADAGELLLDIVRNNFSGLMLDQISPDLATRYYEAWAGCRIQITPAGMTIARGDQVTFIATPAGLPQGFSWSLELPTGGGTIDAQSGLYTAGRQDGVFTVVATSTADAYRFKRATLTVVQITVAVTPLTPRVESGASVQFAATVTNTPNTAVRWTATGGTIDGTGLFTAGSQTGTFTVRATSLEDAAEFDETSVTVTAANALSGRLSYVYELLAKSPGGMNERSELTADVTFREGAFTANGTFDVLLTFPSDCTATIRTQGAVTGATVTSGSITGSFVLSFTVEGTRTTSDCGSAGAPEPVVTSVSSMRGSARVVNGRIVEIDFNFSEVYNFPGHAGFFTQTGSLTGR
jgi:hypothetical protein